MTAVLSYIFVALVMDQTGCSDCYLVENCSEFSSTPNTNTHTTPEPSPIKKEEGGGTSTPLFGGHTTFNQWPEKVQGERSILVNGWSGREMYCILGNRTTWPGPKRWRVKVPGNMNETSWL